MIEKNRKCTNEIKTNHISKASMTVEASLVFPLFLYFFIAFLYFFQIITIQEKLQSAITEMGLNTAKYAFIYQDYIGNVGTESMDQSFLGVEGAMSVKELTDAVIDGALLKLKLMNYVDVDSVNRSCIQDGFSGIDLSYSTVLNEEDCIDIVMRYQVQIPIKLFQLDDMKMIQRVRLRGWTGQQVQANYTIETAEETPEETPEEEAEEKTIAYITETGTVYHLSRNCSHLKLSIKTVQGIPTDLRNDNEGKYYACLVCGFNEINSTNTYYITDDGTRYHTSLNCSGLKRTIIEVNLSQVQGKRACSRCGK